MQIQTNRDTYYFMNSDEKDVQARWAEISLLKAEHSKCGDYVMATDMHNGFLVVTTKRGGDISLPRKFKTTAHGMLEAVNYIKSVFLHDMEVTPMEVHT